MTRTLTITRKRSWNTYRVHALCIKYGLFTCGGNEDLEALLEYVHENEPTDEAMLHVASEIFLFSESGITTLTNLLYLLEREAVIVTFAAEGGTMDELAPAPTYNAGDHVREWYAE